MEISQVRVGFTKTCTIFVGSIHFGSSIFKNNYYIVLFFYTIKIKLKTKTTFDLDNYDF